MLPLKGIRILDLSRILAGPYCSMLLGDMGADVIKIENINKGDDTRQWGPPFAGEDSIYFWSVNRNKRSVCVDFRTKQGNDLIRKLCTKCDVLIENFIPNTLKKYGLDYQSLKEVSPSLIYCSITGFGQQGPMAQRPGYDVVAAGIGGLLNITGPENGPPCRVGVAVTDLMTGLLANSSILAALVSRLGSGHQGGCHIDCNLLSTQIGMLFHMGANYLTKKIESPRIGTAHNTIVPYQAFLTEDRRYFIIAATNEKQFSILCERLQVPQLTQDPRFLTNALRVTNKEHLLPILENIFASKSLEHWEDLFGDSPLPNGPVNNMEEAFSHPQVRFFSDTLINSWLDSDGNEVNVPGFPIRCSSWQAAKCPTRPPKLGEHTKEVLSSLLNYSDGTIEQLENCMAICTRK